MAGRHPEVDASRTSAIGIPYDLICGNQQPLRLSAAQLWLI
jgi:hypothetical protein